MKKTLLLVCTFISLSTISQAQITKGSILLGGNVGFSKGKTEAEGHYESKSHMLNFSPTVGIAVKENWIIGLHAGFSDYEADPTESYFTKQDDESYSAGVFVRRYAALGKNFYLFGNGSINYNEVNQNEINPTIYYVNHFHSKGVALSLTPGIAYALNKRFHLEAALNDLLTIGYTKSSTKYSSASGGIITGYTTRGKNFDFGTNFSATAPLTIGFRFVLGQ